MAQDVHYGMTCEMPGKLCIFQETIESQKQSKDLQASQVSKAMGFFEAWQS